MAYVIAETMVNTMVLILWKYLEMLQRRIPLSLERYHLTEYDKSPLHETDLQNVSLDKFGYIT